MMKPSSSRFIKAPIGLDYSQMSFRKGGEGIKGSTLTMMMVIMLQGSWPWTGVTLPPVDNFLEGRDGMSHRYKVPTSPGTIQRTVNWTLFP